MFFAVLGLFWQIIACTKYRATESSLLFEHKKTRNNKKKRHIKLLIIEGEQQQKSLTKTLQSLDLCFLANQILFPFSKILNALFLQGYFQNLITVPHHSDIYWGANPAITRNSEGPCKEKKSKLLSNTVHYNSLNKAATHHISHSDNCARKALPDCNRLDSEINLKQTCLHVSNTDSVSPVSESLVSETLQHHRLLIIIF